MGDWIPDHRCDCSVRDDGGAASSASRTHGDVLVSPVAHGASLVKLGVEVTRALNVGRFSEGQRGYLRFHREGVLLRSKYLDDA